MPKYRLAPTLVEDLIAALLLAHKQTAACAAYLERMDPHRVIVQDALRHNRVATGTITTAVGHARDLRELMRQANARPATTTVEETLS